MPTVRLLFLYVIVCSLCLPAPALATPPSPATPPGWSEPAILYPETWPAPRYVSFSNDGARLVALIPNSGSDDNSRHIVFSEAKNGVWQTPVVVAQNGAYSEAGFQVLPQRTHPVISGDGKTIAYVGYTGTTFGVYVLNRAADGAWSAPALINTDLPNTHYWISLNRTGSTLALSDYPFLGIQQLYVLDRRNGVWGAPVRVSLTSGPHQGGGMPSLSEDGSRLVFIGNTQVLYSQRTATGWSAPVAVTSHDGATMMAEYPQLSGDGMSIVYWLVTLTPSGGYQVRTSQDLYGIWWEGSGWGAPRLVNPDAGAAIQRNGRPGCAQPRRDAHRLHAPRHHDRLDQRRVHRHRQPSGCERVDQRDVADGAAGRSDRLRQLQPVAAADARGPDVHL
jgi:hypothetical protein